MAIDEKALMAQVEKQTKAMEAMTNVLAAFDGRMKAIEAKPAGAAAAVATGPKKLFGGRTGRRAIKDLKTGIVYPSLSACSKAVASEFKDANGVPLSQTDVYAWYKMIATEEGKTRFVDATPEEAAAAEAKRIADAEKERLVLQAKLDAEAKAADAKAVADAAAAAKAAPKK